MHFSARKHLFGGQKVQLLQDLALGQSVHPILESFLSQ